MEDCVVLKKSVCCAFVALSLGWQASKGSLDTAARADNATRASVAPAEDARQSKPAADAAERDAAIAKIKERLAGHEDEPAEQVFKNIEVLKGKKASVLPGMMSALTGLLGVSCTHCHVSNQWDSEDKPAKQTARKMFRMVKTINRDNFDGRNAVSCWTCHRGDPHPPLK